MYIGEFQRGIFDGFGVYASVQGDRFQGQFKSGLFRVLLCASLQPRNGKPNGLGILMHDDGAREEGYVASLASDVLIIIAGCGLPGPLCGTQTQAVHRRPLMPWSEPWSPTPRSYCR